MKQKEGETPSFLWRTWPSPQYYEDWRVAIRMELLECCKFLAARPEQKDELHIVRLSEDQLQMETGHICLTNQIQE